MFGPFDTNGPLLPFNATSRFCGAARRTGHSLRLRNLGKMNSQSADKAALLFSPFANAANIRTCGTPIAEMQLRSRKPPFDAAARPKSHAVISPHSDGTICTAENGYKARRTFGSRRTNHRLSHRIHGTRMPRKEPTSAPLVRAIIPTARQSKSSRLLSAVAIH
jgi:hypothetical protein